MVSLKDKLIGEGFLAWDIFSEESLPKLLPAYLIDLAKREFTDFCVLPIELALEGSKYEPTENYSSVLYVKNPKTTDSDSARLFVLPCRNRLSGEHTIKTVQDLFEK